MRFTPAPPPPPLPAADARDMAAAEPAAPVAADSQATVTDAAASAQGMQAATAATAATTAQALTPDAAAPSADTAVDAAATVPVQAAAATAPPPLATPAPSRLGVFVPLLIALVALVAWSAFQFYQLRLEAEAMATLRTNQEAPLQQAQRVRQNLENLAARTRELAEAGNANARLVVNELSRRGVKIGPPASAAATK